MPNSSITLRDCRDGDIATITKIYAHAVQHNTATFELEPPDDAEMKRRWQSITGDGFPYLVAEKEGEAVGYAYVNFFRLRRAYRFSVEDSIYVAPNHQGWGIGSLLLGELIKRCETMGFRSMIAVIGDSTNAASIHFHTKQGFSHSGVLPAVGRKFDQWIDVVLMTRPLGSGANTPPQERR